MLNSTKDSSNKIDNDFLLSKIVFWMQFVFFGGWNGLQILLQPQDLSVFVADRGLLDNFFFTLSYSWENIPLLYLIIIAIAAFWIYRSVSLDLQFINSLKRKDAIAVIPDQEKDNITIFITTINIVVWIIALSVIYLLPYWDMNFLTDMFYNISGIDKVKEPLYLLIILFTATINFLLRIQMLLFYEGDVEFTALSKFAKSFVMMKRYYVKIFLITLLTTTLSTLIYKQVFLGFFVKARYAIPSDILVNFPLMINRVDVLSAIPSLILLFLVACFFFSPLVIYLYQRIVKSQYEFFKQQYMKEKLKKDIDENYESIIISENEI